MTIVKDTIDLTNNEGVNTLLMAFAKVPVHLAGTAQRGMVLSRQIQFANKASKVLKELNEENSAFHDERESYITSAMQAPLSDALEKINDKSMAALAQKLSEQHKNDTQMHTEVRNNIRKRLDEMGYGLCCNTSTISKTSFFGKNAHDNGDGTFNFAELKAEVSDLFDEVFGAYSPSKIACLVQFNDEERVKLTEGARHFHTSFDR
ncbi:hypothetical protein AB4254_13695 [Vibrio breoganii]